MPRPLVKALALAFTIPFGVAWLRGETKDDETLEKARGVLQEMLTKEDFAANLARSQCILVLPEVKKVGIGIGGSGGRGPMSCRQGQQPKGQWSAPAFYSIGGASIGLQIGGSSTDFVVLVMNKAGMDALLKGKTKLGTDASAAAGSSGSTATSVGSDMLTYGKTSGLFAGASLGNATIEPDENGNKRLYGKPATPREILIDNAVRTPAAAGPLISLLNSKLAKTDK